MQSKAIFSNKEIVEHGDVLILSVKPQVISQVLPEIKDSIRNKRKLLLSIAMGVSLKTLQNVS